MKPSPGRSFLGSSKVEASDSRFLMLLDRTLGAIPENVLPLHTVRKVSLSNKRFSRGLVGLTTWRDADGTREGTVKRRGSQTITFYSELLDELSDKAATAVIAHELAHAWLNEHDHPEESIMREEEADELVASWQFGDELQALDEEAETV